MTDEFTWPDDEAIVTEVRRLAAERPDHIYESLPSGACRYMHPDGPGCLFGHALVNLGVSAEALRAEEAHGGIGISSLLRSMSNGSLLAQARKWMTHVQGLQDDHLTWSEAVEQADYYYPGV